MSNQALIVDADSHVSEPPDVFTSRVSPKWGDRVPHVRWHDNPAPEDWVANRAGELAWFIGDHKVASVGQSAMAGWPEQFPKHPPGYEQAHPAAYDANERLRYMDEAGIQAQVLYPNVAGLGSQRFLLLKEPELMLECVRAWNDFLIDWTAPDPARFVPMMVTPMWDVEAIPAEIARAANKGHRGIVFTGSPQSHGLPYLADRAWDPLWAAAQDAELPISFHVGSGNLAEGLSHRISQLYGIQGMYTKDVTDSCLKNGIQLTDIIMSGVLARFPRLKFVSVESGIGWIPFMLDCLDYHFKLTDVARDRPEFTMLPSEYFHRSIYACYWFETTAPRHLLDAVGVDNILFETDFPHPTCLFGNIRETIENGLGGQSEEVRHKILFENAAKLYRIEVGQPVG